MTCPFPCRAFRNKNHNLLSKIFISHVREIMQPFLLCTREYCSLILHFTGLSFTKIFEERTPQTYLVIPIPPPAHPCTVGPFFEGYIFRELDCGAIHKNKIREMVVGVVNVRSMCIKWVWHKAVVSQNIKPQICISWLFIREICIPRKKGPIRYIIGVRLYGICTRFAHAVWP